MAEKKSAEKKTVTVRQIRSAARHGLVTLVYSSHDTEHNNAVALKEYLSARTGKKRKLNHV